MKKLFALLLAVILVLSLTACGGSSKAENSMEYFSALFARDEAVILAAADYLRAYGLDCLLTSFLFCFSGYFSGRGKTVFVMLQGVIGAFLVRIPVSFLVSRIPGVSLFAIGLATPASTLVQIILCGAYFMREMRQERAVLGAKA